MMHPRRIELLRQLRERNPLLAECLDEIETLQKKVHDLEVEPSYLKQKIAYEEHVQRSHGLVPRTPAISRGSTLDEIADAANDNAIKKGFSPKGESDDTFLNKQLLNLHAEVSELHEAWRAGTLHHLCDKSDKMAELGLPRLTCIEEEYADIILRALHQCRRLNVNILGAVQVKHAFNVSRPHLHGKPNS